MTLRRLKKNMGIGVFFRNQLKVVDFLDDILSDQPLLKGGARGLNRQVVEITWIFVGFMVYYGIYGVSINEDTPKTSKNTEDPDLVGPLC